MSIKIVNDVDKAIFVMQDAGNWLVKSDKNPSKWWLPENLNKDFLFEHARPEEFYAVLENGTPAAAMILQASQGTQDWKSVDGNTSQNALYIHWGAVHRTFAGKGFTKIMVEFAQDLARKNNISLIRLDTDMHRDKLKKIYENLGFILVGTKDEGYRTTAYYQKKLTHD